jgi:hypothetical protein
MTEIDVSNFFDNAAFTMRMTPGSDPRVSIMDFVMAVTGQNNKRASETIKNLESTGPDFFGKLQKYQFSGASQRIQFVLCLSESVELLMMLPGKKAKEFRKDSAGLLTRLFAGDPTLHDDGVVKTSTEIDVSNFFNNAVFTMRMTPGSDPRVSIMDFVMAVTGKNNNDASEVIRNMQKADQVFYLNCKKYQFPGARQKEQFVLCLSECVELLMMLPGKKAKEFRKDSAGLLTRLFAGDPTLHDVIEKNRLSDGVVNQLARAEVGNTGAVEMQSEEETQIAKKIRVAVMMQELDGIEHKRSVAEMENQNMTISRTKTQMEHIAWLCAQCTEGAPESQKRWIEESNRNYKISVLNTAMGGGQLVIENSGPVYTDDMQPVSISTHIILPKGLKDTDYKIAKAVGKIASFMYRDSHDGKAPFQESVIINGLHRDVNKYCKKDLPLLEAAYVEWEMKTGEAALQRAEKEQKKRDKARKEQVEEDATIEENKRKSSLLANQPSIHTLWG